LSKVDNILNENRLLSYDTLIDSYAKRNFLFKFLIQIDDSIEGVRLNLFSTYFKP